MDFSLEPFSCRKNVSRYMPYGKRFHVFFIYREVHKDRSWVQKIMNQLENRNFICGCHERDFIPGVSIQQNASNCLKSSLKIVIVLSEAFMESGWCEYELNVAHALTVTSGKQMIIPVILDDCKVPDALLSTTYLNVNGNIQTWWPMFYAAVAHEDMNLSTTFQEGEMRTLVSSLQQLLTALKSSSIGSQLHFLQLSQTSGLTYFVSQVGEAKMYSCLMNACGIVPCDDIIILEWSIYFEYLLNQTHAIKDIAHYFDSTGTRFSEMKIKFKTKMDCNSVTSWIPDFKTFVELILKRPGDVCKYIKPIMDFSGHDDGFLNVELQVNSVMHKLFPSCLNKIGYPQYNCYLKRLDSYEAWTWTNEKQPSELSSAGFFYSGFIDLVGCYSCGVRLFGWRKQDDPWKTHAYYCPNCPHIIQNKSREFIIHAQSLHQEHATQKTFEKFSTFESRLKSFRGYLFDYVDSIDLADAGFYYCVIWKISDNVKCFSCGLSLFEWQSKDHPWVEHAKWSPDCKYLLKEKGIKFVDMVKSRLKATERILYEVHFSFAEPLRVDEMLQHSVQYIHDTKE